MTSTRSSNGVKLTPIDPAGIALTVMTRRPQTRISLRLRGL
jgi:hypothetical protein